MWVFFFLFLLNNYYFYCLVAVLGRAKAGDLLGARALDFALFNQGMIDKTLLVNVEVKRIDRPGEKGFKG